MCVCLLICESQTEPMLLRIIADWVYNRSFLKSVVIVEKSVTAELNKKV